MIIITIQDTQNHKQIAYEVIKTLRKTTHCSFRTQSIGRYVCAHNATKLPYIIIIYSATIETVQTAKRIPSQELYDYEMEFSTFKY